MKRKLWQFRLRSLFVLLFLSALAAAWWSHRCHCLERAEYHMTQRLNDELEAANADSKGFVVAVVNHFSFEQHQLQEQEEYERKLREYERGPIDEERINKILRDRLSRQGSAASSDFFNASVPEQERIAAAISSGYLLAPLDGRPVPQSVGPPPLPPLTEPEQPTAQKENPRPPPPQPPATTTLVPSLEQTAWESRAKALHARAEFHAQQEERYRTAIYRPWTRLQEEVSPNVPAGPK